MNEPDQRELARLREQQARLETELQQLSRQLAAFEQRIAQSPSAETASQLLSSKTTRAQVPVPPPLQHSTIPTPPPIIQSVASTGPALPKPASDQASTMPRATQPAIHVSEPFRPASAEQSHSKRTAAESIPLPPPLVEAPPQIGERSFEMRLGTFWLVRIGVVMVLTGLVFFGNLAYQNYISKLGPGGKVSLLYLASGCLLAGGWWWQRKAVKESLRNYAQVLFAGGLAALYFTTYAAHHLEPLQVIASAALDGLLLLVCAGCMVWAAERKKSEVLALFAVGLAYYTSIITRVGYFTLWSNLVLSAAAVFFLVRNRWAALSFGSLAATYAAYAFWRFFNGTDWHWAAADANLWSGTCFLIAYWLVFTAAVFLSRHSRFAGQNRASFLTINNGAFFTLFLLTMLQVHHAGFWKFCIVFGAVLLVLAVVARLLLEEEPLAANAYLIQGLLLVTVGFISKFSGMQLALVLATESVLLVVTGQQRKNLVLLTGAYISAALAVGWGMDAFKPFDNHSLWLGIGLGILMMANSWFAHKNLAAEQPMPGSSTKLLRPQPSYFAVLALVVWTLVTWHNTDRDIFPLVIGLEAVLLTASIYLLGIPEVALLSQGVMLFGLAGWLFNRADPSVSLPWWNPALMIILSLALSHWWPRQNRIKAGPQNKVFWPALYALGINLVLYLWLAPKQSGPMWLVTTSLVAIGLTIYGVATRAWFVAAFGQIFLAVSVAQFALQLWQSPPPWRFSLAPIAALGVLSFGTVQWFRLRPAAEARVRDPLLETALVYRWVALAMSIAWICQYVPGRERIWVLSLTGLLIFLWAGLKRNREALLFSAAFTATALVVFWLPLVEASTVYFPNLVAILVLLTQRQVARRLPERYPLDPSVHNAVILIGGLSLWVFVSRSVLEMANGFYLTASWSVLALALFTVGLMLRERMYRWIGLGILACALGRVVIFDVWKLETVYRILSFMALGIVLLVLGFIYSKYQEKIKEWL